MSKRSNRSRGLFWPGLQVSRGLFSEGDVFNLNKNPLSVNPFLAASEVYQREPCARTFEHDLFLHLMHGTVISTPELFAMVRPVRISWPIDALRDPSVVAEDGPAWWIWLAAGDVGRLFDLLPAREWVGFERLNVPRVYRHQRLKRLFKPAAGRLRACISTS